MGPCVSLLLGVPAPSSKGNPLAFISPPECLFFPDAAMPCRHASNCHRKGCTYAHDRTSLVRFLELLRSAKRTLDICVFTITCNEIAQELLGRHRDGVKVRIITDSDQAGSQGSDIQECRRAGIEVHDNQKYNSRTGGSGGSGVSLMHHKFAVIDNAQLLTGSFNWTRSAVLNNNENVLVLSESGGGSGGVIASYKAEFDRLWGTFS
jgi:cardiolipin hydrolase